MSNIFEKYRNLRALICEANEGTITPDGMAELNTILANDPEAVEYYVDMIDIQSHVKAILSDATIESSVYKKDDDSLKLLLKLAENEDNAFPVELPKGKPELTVVAAKTVKEGKWLNFYRYYSMLVSVAAVLMVLLIVYANVFPAQLSQPVAIVTDQLNTKWASSSSKLQNGQRILTNQLPYKLEKGILQFSYDDGVDLVIEGPAEFVVEKKGLFLNYGQLYASVTDVGRGFTVDTPNNRFIDLGTEFGVAVAENSMSELHVLKGQVQYFSGGSRASKKSMVLRENDARRFDSHTGDIIPIPVASHQFVRYVDSSSDFVWRGQDKLDLVALVSNKWVPLQVGDAIGIDPARGKYVSIDFNDRSVSNNVYLPFNASEYIDGVFIPDGEKGEVTITSAGDTFVCPDTSGGFSQNIALYRSGVVRAKDNISPVIFNGVNIEDSPHSIMCLHSNCGITIDLQAVMSSLPDSELSGFKTTGGITEYVDGLKGRQADVDFWVLVDGKVMYERKLLKIKDGTINLDIKLGKDARFLTFIVTDGLRETDNNKDNIWANDFFYLIDPILEIVRVDD
ncbi:MAG: NPCBM/NEW2 domain-containing protein [Sedimentisphaerales bacterium]|nr:NPCBM/NEW2 domain-containing protein [Sedimentisphaerales bacterium]MBN2844148.1 NPCBM/NEW2 domain-containing protein [Sedimentisphaerales bacterium]